jgi:1-acyl-sn-glycerol-3-phosphate acyltransferase
VSWFFYFTKAVYKTFFFLCIRLKVNGRENIPHTGPLMVVPNHITFAEPFLIGILLGRNMRFATIKGFFRYKPAKIIMQSLGGFPVCQGVTDRKIIHMMEQHIKDGFALVIFPEGRRSLQAKLLPGLNGPALIAQRTGALILPVGISGTEKMRGFWYFRRPQITVNFGHPFQLPVNNGKLTREEATQIIMKRIRDLLPPEYHGFYTENEK